MGGGPPHLGGILPHGGLAAGAQALEGLQVAQRLRVAGDDVIAAQGLQYIGGWRYSSTECEHMQGGCGRDREGLGLGLAAGPSALILRLSARHPCHFGPTETWGAQQPGRQVEILAIAHGVPVGHELASLARGPK